MPFTLDVPHVFRHAGPLLQPAPLLFSGLKTPGYAAIATAPPPVLPAPLLQAGYGQLGDPGQPDQPQASMFGRAVWIAGTDGTILPCFNEILTPCEARRFRP